MDTAKHRREQGLTLVELLVTLTVLSILLLVAVPSFAELVANNRLVSTLNEFTGVMNYARSEAIKRGMRVVICPTGGGSDCVSTSEWQGGVLLFADEDADGNHDETETVIHRYRPQMDEIAIYSGQRRKITYQAVGTSPGSNLTLTFCDPSRRADPRALILSNAGRLRSSETQAEGGPLSCP